MEKKNFFWLAVFVVGSLAAGLIGSFFTFESIPTWYAGLSKPSFNPPNWVFGPVWTLLYVMMGVSAFLVWTSKTGARKQTAGERNQKFFAIGVFVVQLVLNALWSILFFGVKNLGLAFAEIVLLWLSIAACIYLFRRFSTNAALLLVPYLCWVSFASLLNYSVWMLNG